jgi:hypothetical protein
MLLPLGHQRFFYVGKGYNNVRGLIWARGGRGGREQLQHQLWMEDGVALRNDDRTGIVRHATDFTRKLPCTSPYLLRAACGWVNVYCLPPYFRSTVPWFGNGIFGTSSSLLPTVMIHLMSQGNSFKFPVIKTASAWKEGRAFYLRTVSAAGTAPFT